MRLFLRPCCVCCCGKKGARRFRPRHSEGFEPRLAQRREGKGRFSDRIGSDRAMGTVKKISNFNSFFVFMVCTIRVVFFGGAYFNVGKNSRSKYGRKYRWLVITDECKDLYMNVSTRRGKNLKSFNLSKNRFERNVRPRPSGADGAVAWARGRVAIFHSATNGKNKNSPLTDGQKYDTISLQKV